MSKRWIQTRSGHAFEPLNPDPMKIMIADIAVSLSRACRFTGHTIEHYSVAQHSVFVSHLVEVLAIEAGIKEPGGVRRLARAGLMHDASEAYLVDIPAPIKPHLHGYAEIEQKVMAAVGQKFCIPLEDLEHPLIKVADRRMLSTEKRDVMGPEPESWGDLLEPIREVIFPLSAPEAEDLFLTRCEELFR